MSTPPEIFRGMAGLTLLMTAACSGYDSLPMPPAAPAPPSVTATAYILPGAAALGSRAFGEPPLIVYKGERLRWVNLDSLIHALVADGGGVPDFVGTGELPPGGEQSFITTATGTTTFHCTIHPGMVGTLVIRDR